ncbi:unnamed protein product [Arctia plantaginis]|uniref:Single domain-containing protein n=1 Tax=Arctia plantaginis TaxID=874455 RepID=A0A8S1BSB1_ARCPL|nr:unnamed protein product [Arctia plantaginis]
MKTFLTLGLLAVVSASPTSTGNKDVNAQGYKDQYCTDPRTMRKHAAYTEWADAYSCTRHRCQPGGRNLAIYTVGCKRVEAPESAIECEEVVEDTNMQFPFCCTRLRCLVVVRGEVWTRVLGQPWEVLPAAPWSHMYKMKKPPPSDTTFQPKIAEQGPVYELSETESDTSNAEKLPRSARKQAPTDSPDCNEVVPRSSAAAAPAPDIVIALSTNSEKDSHSKRPRDEMNTRRQSNAEKSGIVWQDQAHDSESDTEHKRIRKTTESSVHNFEKEEEREHREGDVPEVEDNAVPTEKTQNPEASEEKFYGNSFVQKDQPQKPSKETHHRDTGLTDIPQNQWSEHEGMDVEPRAHVMELRYTQEPATRRDLQPAREPEPEKERKEEKHEKSSNLQALVDAIGSRMKDIENVVQKMSEKVHQTKSPLGAISSEKRHPLVETDFSKRHRVDLDKVVKPKHEQEHDSAKAGEDHYKPRFAIKGHGSKYLQSSTEPTQEQPLFIEDNGNYFSDASNIMRRSNNVPKEPAQSALTYMAPVETHHKSPVHIAMVSDNSEDQERKKKKHNHKKKRSKSHTHKKHQHTEKRKHFNKLASAENDKNTMSAEDSSGLLAK